MRQSKVKELGMRGIEDICELEMTAVEVATTFDLVIDSLADYVKYEAIVNILADGLADEAEEILKEAFGNVDQ